MELNNVYYPNHDDYEENFWSNNYRVLVTAQGIEFMVNADNEQETIDYIIDYCEEHLTGLLFSDDKVEELRQESIADYNDERYVDDYICGGNHGRYLNTHNIHIEQV